VKKKKLCRRLGLLGLVMVSVVIGVAITPAISGVSNGDISLSLIPSSQGKMLRGLVIAESCTLNGVNCSFSTYYVLAATDGNFYQIWPASSSGGLPPRNLASPSQFVNQIVTIHDICPAPMATTYCATIVYGVGAVCLPIACQYVATTIGYNRIHTS